MAITIQNAAGNTASVNDELLFVVYEATKASDEATYPDYRYVCDVYVDDVFAARLKARPDPIYKMGKFDVSTILRSYVTYGLKANYASDYETYQAIVSYKLKFGEEYGDTLYTNLLVDSDSRDAFKTYAERPFINSNVIDSVADGFVTNMPSVVTGYKTDKWFLLSYYHNVTGFNSFTYQFSDGQTNIGAPGTIPVSYVAKEIAQGNFGFVKRVAALGLSTEQQNAITQMQVDCDTGQVITVKYGCTKYTPITLAWLNQYGAYDSYSFGLVSKKTIELTRKDFAQLNYRLNPSGVVSYHEDGVFYGSKKGFATNVKVSEKLTSHLLSEQEYQWLAELFASPDVYKYDPDLDKFMPVTISETNYEYRTYKNSKNTPLEFNIQYSDQYNAQYL